MNCLAETTYKQGDVMNEKDQIRKGWLRKGQAFREYLGVKGEVQRLLKEGYGLGHIHHELTKSKRITMSYEALRYNVGGGSRSRRRQIQKRGEVGNLSSTPAVQTQSVTEAPEIKALPEVLSKSETQATVRPSPRLDSAPIQSPERPNNLESGDEYGGSLDSILKEIERKQDSYLNSNPEQQALAERLVGNQGGNL
jgi:hypothetical protein